MSELQVTRVTDKSSPVLFQLCVTGKHIKTATLAVRKAGGSPYLKVKLTDAVISAYSETSTPSKPTETLSLSYNKIEYQYSQQK